MAAGTGGAMSARPTVTFVIPVRDDAARLARCLASIRRNRYPASRIELIVVDNGSTDDSALVARHAGARVLTMEPASVAELRNAGAAEATGDLLAFVDADHVIDAGWIASAVEALGAHAIGAAGAPYRGPADGTWVQRAYDGLRRRPAGRLDVDWLPSGNLVVRRAIFRLVHGFDARLVACEDVDFCQRVRAAGYRVVDDPGLKSTHLGDPASLAALFRGELWRGRDNLRVSLRPGWRHQSWRALPGLAIPVVDLALLALAAGGLATASLAGGIVSLSAIALFFGVASIRTSVMAARLRPMTAAAGLQAFAVALVYDAARALALVVPATHAWRRR